MGRKNPGKLGHLEWRIMEVVWANGPVTSRQVLENLNDKSQLAYTTIMTTMRNLEKKGALRHTSEQRTYVYTAVLKKPDAVRRVLKDIVSIFFRSSYTELANALVDGEIMADDEVASVIEVINRMNYVKSRESKHGNGANSK
jgi:BlaI family transcriptional regulator, penicillinase repressor